MSEEQSSSKGDLKIDWRQDSDKILIAQGRLSKFSGATAISSADFYGDGEGDSSKATRGGSFDLENMNASEMISRLSMNVSCYSYPSPPPLHRSTANSVPQAGPVRSLRERPKQTHNNIVKRIERKLLPYFTKTCHSL